MLWLWWLISSVMKTCLQEPFTNWYNCATDFHTFPHTTAVFWSRLCQSGWMDRRCGKIPVCNNQYDVIDGSTGSMCPPVGKCVPFAAALVWSWFAVDSHDLWPHGVGRVVLVLRSGWTHLHDACLTHSTWWNPHCIPAKVIPQNTSWALSHPLQHHWLAYPHGPHPTQTPPLSHCPSRLFGRESDQISNP